MHWETYLQIRKESKQENKVNLLDGGDRVISDRHEKNLIFSFEKDILHQPLYVMQYISKLGKIYWFCHMGESVGETFETEMGTQQGSRRVLPIPSLLNWNLSNLPFLEYWLWECYWCCWALPDYMKRWVYLWLASTAIEIHILRTHLLARLSWLPSGNWHIPLLIIKVMWHMYS